MFQRTVVQMAVHYEEEIHVNSFSFNFPPYIKHTTLHRPTSRACNPVKTERGGILVQVPSSACHTLGLFIYPDERCNIFLRNVRKSLSQDNSALLSYRAEPILRNCQLCSHSRTSQHFKEPKGTISCSQEPSTGPYLEP
jgi:hypothetical protein